MPQRRTDEAPGLPRADSQWDWVAERIRTYLASGGTEGHDANGVRMLVLGSQASIEEQIEAIRHRAGDVGVFHLNPDVELDVPGVTTAELAVAPRFVALRLSNQAT